MSGKSRDDILPVGEMFEYSVAAEKVDGLVARESSSVRIKMCVQIEPGKVSLHVPTV